MATPFFLERESKKRVAALRAATLFLGLLDGSYNSQKCANTFVNWD